MIKTIFIQSTRPAGELPRYCYIGVAGDWIPVRTGIGQRSGLILATATDRRNFTMRFRTTDIVTALVPDSWDNARWDIAFDLMQKGAI